MDYFRTKRKPVMIALLSLLLVAGQAVGTSLNITSFNVLAEMWLGGYTTSGQWLKWYRGVDLSAFQRSRRVVGQLEYLSECADDMQIIALQEITAFEYNMTQRLFGDRFTGFWAQNAATYWANQVIAPERTWEPNGNAIYVSKSAFNSITFQDVALSNSGNHGAFFRGRHTASGRWVRTLSVHFDDGSDAKREREARAAIDALESQKNQHTDVIVGDINSGVKSAVTGVQRQVFTDLFAAGFKDVATEVGKAQIATHPWNIYVDDTRPDGYPSYDPAIDHFVVRNAAGQNNYRVRNFNTETIVDETARIERTIVRGGSDHFSLRATLELP